MITKKGLLTIFAAILLVLAGCSSDSEKTKEAKQKQTEAAEKTKSKEKQKKEEKEEEEETAKTAAQKDTDYEKYMDTDLDAMMQMEPGEFSGDRYNVEEVKKRMDVFPAGDTAENYYYRTLALIAEDYRPYRAFFNQVDTSYAENSAAPDEEAASPAKQSDTQVNVAVLFDASGSMGKQIGAKTQMDLAKEAVNDFLSQLPEGVQVSLRAYGHKGTGSDADKAMSCKSSEEVYPLGAYDSQKMKKALNTFSPAGWTPLAASIRAAGKDLKKQTGDNVENIVYVVSDGVETCGGDPVKEAKALNQSDIQAVVNIIGFDVDDAGQKALKKVAEAGKGKYATVRTKQELENFFIKARTDLINEWYSWENSNVNEIYKSQNERVNELYKMENDMVNKAYTEENRLRELSYYLAEKFDTEDVTVRQKARTRGLDLRRYARHTALDFRQTLRNKGLDNRNDIRKKSRQARDKIRNEDKK